MKIIRHTARDMRQAMRAVREQLGEDAVILSSRRTSDGVELTAAVDFEAGTLEAGGFSNLPAEPPVIEATVVAAPRARLSAPPAAATSPARLSSAPAAAAASARLSSASAAAASSARLS